MRLTIRLFAGLRERAGTDEVELADLPSTLDVAGLKAELEKRFPGWGSLAFVRGVLGTSYVAEDTELEDGAEVSLLPPVSGGTADPLDAGVFELYAEDLDVSSAHQRVAHESCGAIVVFTGTTRATNRGQDVAQLDYEAFEAMAGPEMRRIFDECVERFGPPSAGAEQEPDARRLRLLVFHRTGTVGVGEPSVVVAAASPHRDSAFQAARFLIDELKARVPLWKKEVYGDGHHWIGERS